MQLFGRAGLVWAAQDSSVSWCCRVIPPCWITLCSQPLLADAQKGVFVSSTCVCVANTTRSAGKLFIYALFPLRGVAESLAHNSKILVLLLPSKSVCVKQQGLSCLITYSQSIVCIHQAICSDLFFFFHLCVNSEQDKVMTIFIYNITLFSLSCWHSFVIWLPTMQISYRRRNSVVWARDPCHTTHYSQDLRDEQQLSQLCAAHLVWSFKKTRK